MIKEMGDGFLCSVGFPFKHLGSDIDTSAIEFAERIVASFTNQIIKLGTREPIYCSTGVARGRVKAYFSKSGSIRHDLWGDGIVKATRYEALRKDIFEILNIVPSNIIILQQQPIADRNTHIKN